MPLGILICYDAEGNVTSTLEQLVVRDPDTGRAIGIVDFLAHEAQGGKFRVGPDRPDGYVNDPRAIGSGAWPEWLGSRAAEFKVEVHDGRITRLRHADSGHVRDRAKIEKAIRDRINAANGEPADIRDLVGGPQKPLELDGAGRTVTRHPPRLPQGRRQQGT